MLEQRHNFPRRDPNQQFSDPFKASLPSGRNNSVTGGYEPLNRRDGNPGGLDRNSLSLKPNNNLFMNNAAQIMGNIFPFSGDDHKKQDPKNEYADFLKRQMYEKEQRKMAEKQKRINEDMEIQGRGNQQSAYGRDNYGGPLKATDNNTMGLGLQDYRQQDNHRRNDDQSSVPKHFFSNGKNFSDDDETRRRKDLQRLELQESLQRQMDEKKRLKEEEERRRLEEDKRYEQKYLQSLKELENETVKPKGSKENSSIREVDGNSTGNVDRNERIINRLRSRRNMTVESGQQNKRSVNTSGNEDSIRQESRAGGRQSNFRDPRLERIDEREITEEQATKERFAMQFYNNGGQKMLPDDINNPYSSANNNGPINYPPAVYNGGVMRQTELEMRVEFLKENIQSEFAKMSNNFEGLRREAERAQDDKIKAEQELIMLREHIKRKVQFNEASDYMLLNQVKNDILANGKYDHMQYLPRGLTNQNLGMAALPGGDYGKIPQEAAQYRKLGDVAFGTLDFKFYGRNIGSKPNELETKAMMLAAGGGNPEATRALEETSKLVAINPEDVFWSDPKPLMGIPPDAEPNVGEDIVRTNSDLAREPHKPSPPTGGTKTQLQDAAPVNKMDLSPEETLKFDDPASTVALDYITKRNDDLVNKMKHNIRPPQNTTTNYQEKQKGQAPPPDSRGSYRAKEGKIPSAGTKETKPGPNDGNPEETLERIDNMIANYVTSP